MGMDKGHLPRCLLWHGWLQLLSGANGASPWAETADQGAGLPILRKRNVFAIAKLDVRAFCLRELVERIKRCPCSFRRVAIGEDTFASHILSMAHDLGGEDPLDPIGAVEMVEGTLADLKTA